MNTQNANMQNMMSAMNSFMNNQSKIVFDPRTLDTQYKRTLISQTIAQSKIGMYKSFKTFKSIKFPFQQNFNPGVPNNICTTEVVYDHALDVAELYAEKGISYTSNNNMNPAVLNVVGKNFSGLNLEANEDIRDDIINIRTTFCNTTGHNSQYPLDDNTCVYSKMVIVIRPKNPTSFLSFPQLYRTALITTAPIVAKKLLSENKMNSSDFVNTCTIIECVFHTAIARGHPILILTPFGHEEENNPVSDIIKIYNYCIFKYGHYFNKIIVAVPQFYPKNVYEAYKTNIINPTEIVSQVEDECEADEMKYNLMAKSKTEETPTQQNTNQMDPEKMQMMMNMLMNMNMSNNHN